MVVRVQQVWETTGSTWDLCGFTKGWINTLMTYTNAYSYANVHNVYDNHTVDLLD